MSRIFGFWIYYLILAAFQVNWWLLIVDGVSTPGKYTMSPSQLHYKLTVTVLLLVIALLHKFTRLKTLSRKYQLLLLMITAVIVLVSNLFLRRPIYPQRYIQIADHRFYGPHLFLLYCTASVLVLLHGIPLLKSMRRKTE
ncbi:hypothetical protein [Flavihumibacter petaseus]|uniref:hypothetical protein n=1 Tax=Flavihumibacter petaseus TaxID=549295 RepID=UPI00061CE225|nr:hypothetical protein [Flavihumibacter petaseus]